MTGLARAAHALAGEGAGHWWSGYVLIKSELLAVAWLWVVGEGAGHWWSGYVLIKSELLAVAWLWVVGGDLVDVEALHASALYLRHDLLKH